jgi:hypothetical protein
MEATSKQASGSQNLQKTSRGYPKKNKEALFLKAKDFDCHGSTPG